MLRPIAVLGLLLGTIPAAAVAQALHVYNWSGCIAPDTPERFRSECDGELSDRGDPDEGPGRAEARAIG
jgi:spermidine/putrescine-binding protein